jgi:hypothetical protein
MSNSQTLIIEGEAYWSKVFPTYKDKDGYDNELTASGGQYTINLDLDADNLMKLVDANSQVPDYPRDANINGSDKTLYRFRRYHEKRNRAGELLEWASGAPRVVDGNGDTWDLDSFGLIPNGSKVQLEVVVYKAGKVYGTRLEQVKVIEMASLPEVA